jgi:hypothetical protein
MLSERNAPKNEERVVGFSFATMLQHTGHFFVRNCLAKNNVKILEQPPYCPDLPSHNFYLIILLKSTFNGRHFCDATDIIKNATEELKRFSQIGFHGYFQHLYTRLQKCVFAQV